MNAILPGIGIVRVTFRDRAAEYHIFVNDIVWFVAICKAEVLALMCWIQSGLIRLPEEAKPSTQHHLHELVMRFSKWSFHMQITTLPLKKKRAALYARVSSEKQGRNGADTVSIQAQVRECEELAQKEGLEVVATFIDDQPYRNQRGKLLQPSGAKSDRPAYRAMIAQTERGEIDTIVAWREDRLYRGVVAMVPFSTMLEEQKHVDVLLVRELFDRRMMPIKAAVAKLELDGIRERVGMGRRERLASGHVPGGKAPRYGYRRVGKGLAVDPYEREVIWCVYNLYVSGVKLLEVRRRLFADGFRPRSGDYFNKRLLSRIVADERYVTGLVKTRLYNETFTYRVEPIVSAELYAKARAVSAVNYATPRNIKDDYLLVGLVWCACGKKMQAHALRGSKGRKKPELPGVYCCPRRCTEPEREPPNCVRTGGCEWVDRDVWALVRKVIISPAHFAAAVQAELNRSQGERQAREEEVATARAELARLETARATAISLAVRGHISEDDLDLQLNALAQEANDLRAFVAEQERLANAKGQADDIASLVSRAAEYAATVAVLETDIEKLGEREKLSLFQYWGADQYLEKYNGDRDRAIGYALLQERRAIVRSLVSRVVLTKHTAADGTVTRTAEPFFRVPLPPEFSVLGSCTA